MNPAEHAKAVSLPFPRKGLLVCSLTALWSGWALPSAGADTLLVGDSLAESSTGTLNGAVPGTEAVGGAWASNTAANTFSFASDTIVSGNYLLANTSVGQTAYVNLGSQIANNPGLYTLSMTVAWAAGTSQSGTSWLGLGFMSSALTSYAMSNTAGVTAAPWLFYRQNGEVDLVGGSGVTNKTAYAGAAPVAGSGSANSYVLTLELDTTTPLWTIKALVDGVELGSFTYASDPASPTYIGISTSGAGSATAAITNFSLSYQAVPEPSSASLLTLVSGAGGLLLLRRRRGRT